MSSEKPEISDESSEDDATQIKALEEDKAVPHLENLNEAELDEKESQLSPSSKLYVQGLLDPVTSVSDVEDDLSDLINAKKSYPPVSPPAYTRDVEQPFPKVISSDEDEDEYDEDFTESEIAVLTYINEFKPEELPLKPELRPFTIEYIPAIGEVDLFVKIPRPDDIDDNTGLTQIDEPPSEQSDGAIVELQIRSAFKQSTTEEDVTPVKVLEKADENPDTIKKWIADIKELHKSKPASTVHYRTKLPDVETLMQEWDPKMEKVMSSVKLPTADLDVPLEQYVDICLNILDIPVGKSRIESLHTMFSLLNEFNNSQHFRNLAQNENRETGERMDRLEL